MSIGLRRLLAMSLATALMLAIVMLVTARAEAQVDQTCNDVGFDNETGSTSGIWGSVTFDDSEPTLTLVVEEGFEVRLCVKAGSAQQGDGPEITDWFGEGTHEVSHSTGKDLSHYGIQFREIPDDEEPTTTQSDEEPTTSPPTTTTTSSSSSTTTEPSDTTTTSAPGSTSTAPPSSTTTIPGITPTTTPDATSITPATPSPEELPFTGTDDRPAKVAVGLLASGLLALLFAARFREQD